VDDVPFDTCIRKRYVRFSLGMGPDTNHEGGFSGEDLPVVYDALD